MVVNNYSLGDGADEERTVSGEETTLRSLPRPPSITLLREQTLHARKRQGDPGRHSEQG